MIMACPPDLRSDTYLDIWVEVMKVKTSKNLPFLTRISLDVITSCEVICFVFYFVNLAVSRFRSELTWETAGSHSDDS